MLRGMTWSHERGIKPLKCASEIFENKYHKTIEWDARSLSDFEIYPLEKLADKYDLIMIDHPHIGAAHEENLLLPLETILEDSFLKQQEKESVGLSYNSYHWEGHQYAIPLDAAAQVAASRKDLFNELQLTIPTNWNEVFDFVHKLPSDKQMAIPFVPVHAYSSFFSLCSQISSEKFWTNGKDLNLNVGVKVLKMLTNMLKYADKDSKDMDPINALDKMNTTNQLVYCPLIYGYVNYSRSDYGKYPVTFSEIPSDNDVPNGSMIGGVGLAISAKCKDVDTAVKYLKMVAEPKYQTDRFFYDGGQPAHKTAWQDKNVNELSNQFFKGTLNTLKHGSMRPRYNGYIDFQREAGIKIRKFAVQGKDDANKLINELNHLVKECKVNKGLK